MMHALLQLQQMMQDPQALEKIMEGKKQAEDMSAAQVCVCVYTCVYILYVLCTYLCALCCYIYVCIYSLCIVCTQKKT